MSAIDRNSPIPLYYQLKEIIKDRIKEGTWQHGDLIPSEAQLETDFGLSRTTVRQALDELAAEGLLSRVQGRGTFVTSLKLQASIDSLRSFSEDLAERDLRPDAELLQFDQATLDPSLVKRLGLQETVPAIRFERLRSADSEPLALQVCYVRSDLGFPVTREQLEAGESLFALVERQGLTFLGAEETLEAVAAGEREAHLLGVEVGSPLFLVERVWYLADGRALGYGHMLYRGDRYRYAHWLPR